MASGRDRVKFFEKPFVSWRNDVALFLGPRLAALGPRLAGYSAVDVEDLTTVELRSRELAVGIAISPFGTRWALDCVLRQTLRNPSDDVLPRPIRHAVDPDDEAAGR